MKKTNIIKPIRMTPPLYMKKDSIKSKRLKPWGDADFDGTANKLDCDPRNPAKDGLLGDIWARTKELARIAAEKAAAAARKVAEAAKALLQKKAREEAARLARIKAIADAAKRAAQKAADAARERAAEKARERAREKAEADRRARERADKKAREKAEAAEKSRLAQIAAAAKAKAADIARGIAEAARLARIKAIADAAKLVKELAEQKAREVAKALAEKLRLDKIAEAARKAKELAEQKAKEIADAASLAAQKAKEIADAATQKIADAAKKAADKAKELAATAKLAADKAAEAVKEKAKEIIEKVTTKEKVVTPEFGTRTDLVQEIETPEIMTEPYLVERKIDEINGTPITEIVYIDPTVVGKQEERVATEAERLYYNQLKNQAIADEIMMAGSFPNTVQGRKDAAKYIEEATKRQARIDFIAPIKEMKEDIKEGLKERIISEETEEKIEAGIKKALPYIIPPLQLLPEKAEEKVVGFGAGAITALIPKTKGAVMLDVATFGIGLGLGAGVRVAEKGVGLAVGKIAPIITKKPEVVTKAVQVGTGLFKGATTVGGAVLGGVYVVGVGKGISVAETPEEKGAIFGKGAKELVLFGAGYAKGTKVAGQWLGSLKAKGRTEIPIEKLVSEEILIGEKMFPEAGRPSAAKHYDIFTGQEHALPITKLKGYTGVGELIYPKTFKKLPFEVPKAGYHATGTQFWGKGKGFEIVPGKPRAGEMVGLDIAEQVSVHFLRAEGKYKLSVKDIFKPTGEGAIARMEPTRFVKGSKVKIGEAAVTGKKAEVQATIPTGTKVEFIEGKYYTVWKGTKVPIDYFKTKVGEKVSVKGKPKTYGEIISSYEYAPLPSYPKVSIVGPFIPSVSVVSKVTPSVSYISKVTPSIPYISKVVPSVPSIPVVSKVTPSVSYISKVSIIPSKVIYKPSVSKLIPSYISKPSSYVPSVVSYAPSYVSKPLSYIPSITPYKPSYVSKPSYRPIITSYRPSYPYSPRKYPPISPPIKRMKRKPAKIKKKVVKAGKGFEGFYKRFGKWKPLAKGTRAQVVAKVKRKVKRELGASYKVKDLSTGKYVMPKITKQFRRSKSKKTPYVVVERRRYRLDSPKEKGEIKAAKRAAKKPKKRKSNRKRNMFFK